MPGLTEETFIELMQTYPEIKEAVYAKVSLNKKSSIDNLGYYFRPFVKRSAWLNQYSKEEVQKLALEISEKMSINSKIKHALGIFSHFSGTRKIYTDYIEKVFSKTKQYHYTFRNLHLRKLPDSSFTRGYYNIPFQESLISSLEEFLNQKFELFLKQKSSKEGISSDEIKILQDTFNSMIHSLEYYKKYEKTNQFDEQSIIRDLNKGEMRIFASGRLENPNFHALNFIIKGDMLVICDRFDVGISTQMTNNGMFPEFFTVDTGRKEGEGAFIYKLRTPFSDLDPEKKKQLIYWFTKEISRTESILSIKKLLDLGNPIATLPGKKQTKGNCRYASKKMAVGGAMLLASLSSNEDLKSIQEKQELVKKLQKQFTSIDRIKKIDEVIDSPFLRSEEKEELLLLILFHNNNPKNKLDQSIYKKIVEYLKKTKGQKETEELLSSLINEMREKINKDYERCFANPAIQKHEASMQRLNREHGEIIQYLNNIVLMLKENSILHDKKQRDEQAHIEAEQPKYKPGS